MVIRLRFCFTWISFRSTDNGIFFGAIVSFLTTRYRPPERWTVVVLFIDDARRSQDYFDFLDTALDESLLIFGSSYSAFSISSPPSMASCKRSATSLRLVVRRNSSSSASF